MRLLVLLATGLTVVQAQAQVDVPYDGFGEPDRYSYEDPYSIHLPTNTREHTLVYTTSWGEQFAYPIAVGREVEQW